MAIYWCNNGLKTVNITGHTPLFTQSVGSGIKAILPFRMYTHAHTLLHCSHSKLSRAVQVMALDCFLSECYSNTYAAVGINHNQRKQTSTNI
jgi:hypothetical protein